MANDIAKENEIKRLQTPLKFKDLKAYDSNGNQASCVETFSDLKFVVEPDTGILSEDEILKYAPDSVAASKIKLMHGYGSSSDVLNVINSIPWILALYYVTAICIAIPYFHTGNSLGMFFILIMFIIPLIYLYYIFNLKNYTTGTSNKSKAKSQAKKTNSSPIQNTVPKHDGLESLKKYEQEVTELKTLYDVKEKVVRDLIEKRFEPPQITYDRFMSTIDKCHDLFYSEADAALNITKLAAEDTPRVDEELESKIKTLKSLIDQIEDLTNELVINISADAKSGDDVKGLIEDMENLIDSVKEYS